MFNEEAGRKGWSVQRVQVGSRDLCEFSPRFDYHAITQLDHYQLWKNPIVPSAHKLLASVSMVVSLPRDHTHDFSTHLDLFTQSVGSAVVDPKYPLSFATLSLESYFRDIAVQVSTRYTGMVHPTELIMVQNIAGDVIKVTSQSGKIDVDATRITGSLSMWSRQGLEFLVYLSDMNTEP